MSLNITLFRDFAEDHRQSMEVYADGLSGAIRAHFPERCRVREYRPHLLPRLRKGVWQMRLARFGVYPWQACWQQGQVNHILDHGYGHLLYVLDPKRTVVTVHDLIPLVRWRKGIPGTLPGRKPYLNLLSFHALRRAKHLIAVTENTRRDLISYCGCRMENITVIHYGVPPSFRLYSPAEKAAARRKWNMPDDGTLRVVVFTTASYKNPIGALQAFTCLSKLVDKALQMVQIGPINREWTQIVHVLASESQIRHLNDVSHSQIPELYNIVDCLLFPSLYEGFGWPPLEAMACGTPVVASNAASLPEVIDDAGLMCTPQDHEGLARAMHAVLANDNLRRLLIERGLARARQFTWEQTARQTLAVYERVAREFHG